MKDAKTVYAQIEHVAPHFSTRAKSLLFDLLFHTEDEFSVMTKEGLLVNGGDDINDLSIAYIHSIQKLSDEIGMAEPAKVIPIKPPALKAVD